MAHGHAHHTNEQDPDRATPPEPTRRANRIMLWILLPVLAATLVGLSALWPAGTDRPQDRPDLQTHTGEVVKVTEMDNSGEPDPEGLGTTNPGALLDVQLSDGPDEGEVVEVPLQPALYASGVEVGDSVKVQRTDGATAGTAAYQFLDFNRTASLIALALAFGVALVVVARRRGALALVGLGFSGFIVLKFMLPALLAGSHPVAVALTAGTAILTVVLYVTHGLSARTTTALLGTLAGMGLATLVGVAVVSWAHLTGITSEDDILLWASAPDMKMTGVVICATIVTAVGILNDVTITQASAVWEMAGDSRDAKDLFKRAMRIGRDHIASSTYTVAFAATGASLATYLLLTAYDRPLGDVVVLEQFSAEIIATLVGALAVVLAMPLTTAVAVAVVKSADTRTPA